MNMKLLAVVAPLYIYHIVTTISFKYLHKLHMTNIMYFSILCLNAYPIKNLISEIFSPREIVVRTNLD